MHQSKKCKAPSKVLIDGAIPPMAPDHLLRPSANPPCLAIRVVPVLFSFFRNLKVVIKINFTRYFKVPVEDRIANASLHPLSTISNVTKEGPRPS